MIEFSLLKPLILMCIVTAITPGPNNFMVLTISTNQGRLKALPAYLGICIGFPLMVLSISFLSVKIGQSFLDDFAFIKYIGAGFLLYLSLKIFFSSTNKENISTASISFLQAFFFQWINPKAWAMVLSTLSLVGTANYLLPSMVYVFVCAPCVGVWFMAGGYIRKYIIGTPLEAWINKLLAVILATSVLLII